MSMRELMRESMRKLMGESMRELMRGYPGILEMHSHKASGDQSGHLFSV